MSFWDWFIGEAGAGWILGMLGVLGGLYTWRNRERPPKIVLQELWNMGLLDIHPSQQNKISVMYMDDEGNGQNVESLQQKRIVLYNNGTVDLSDPMQLQVQLQIDDAVPPTTRLVRLISDKSTCTIDELDDYEFALNIEYLNSYPTHEQFIDLYVVSSHDVTLNVLSRFGKGWSVKYVPLSMLIDQLRVIKRIVSVLLIIFIVLFAYVIFASSFYKGLFNPSVDALNSNIARLKEAHKILVDDGIIPYTILVLKQDLGWWLVPLSIVTYTLVFVQMSRGLLVQYIMAIVYDIQPHHKFFVNQLKISTTDSIKRIFGLN